MPPYQLPRANPREVAISMTPAHHDALPPGAPDPPGGGGPGAQALSEALAAHHFSHPLVDAAVAGFAREARGAGMPPERVLVALKALLRPFEANDAAHGERAAGEERRWQLVGTAVRAYYRAD